MPNRKRICRLCLGMCINTFGVIKDHTKETLDILLLKIDLSVSEEPVMCTNCAENLEKFFDFKSVCFSTQGYVAPLINNKKSARLGQRDGKGDSENSICIPKDPNIYGSCMLCGLCMNPLTSRSLISQDSKEGGVVLEKIMLEKCLPELDQNVTKKPIMCAACHGFLEKYFSFVKNCAIVEEKIKKYCDASGTNGKGPIELNDVLQFTSKNILSEHDDTCNIIKVEETFCDDGENTNDVENKSDTFMEMEDHKFIGELRFSKKNMLNCQEDVNKVETIKIEGESYEEIKNKVGHNNENFLEMEDRKFLFDEEIEIKTDEHDISSFQDDVVLPQPEATISLSERPKVLMPYQCEYCSYQSKYKYKIRKHNMVHKNVSEVTMHQCVSCPYQTKYKENLKKHSVIHKSISEVTMHQCDSCPYQTRYKENLKKHSVMHKNVSEVIMHQCDSCPYQSKYKHKIRKHSMVHKSVSEVTMHQCDSCPYQTKYKGNLKMHSVIHKNVSEVTMHQCDSCPYQSKYKHKIRKHNMVHKNVSEVTVHQCDSWQYQLKYKHMIRKHNMVHKNVTEVTMYQCDSCPFQTKCKDSLKNHSIIHKIPSDLTMYQCDTCSYQTLLKYDFYKHVLIHNSSSKVKMYQCESCSFQTEFKHYLKRQHNA